MNVSENLKLRVKYQKQNLNGLAWLPLREEQDDEHSNPENAQKRKSLSTKQLGFVKDWTDDFILGHYSVLWQDQNLDELAASILSTITKYSGEDAEAEKKKYKIEQILLSSTEKRNEN